MSITSVKNGLAAAGTAGDPWTLSTTSSTSYTVPSGRTLVLTTAAHVGGALNAAYIQINGVTAYLAQSYNNVANTAIAPVCFMAGPMIFRAGSTIVFGSSASTATFAGYLI